MTGAGTLRIALLGAALVGLGGAGGYLLGATRAPIAAVAAPAACAGEVRVIRGEPGASEAELRRAVREELAASRAGELGEHAAPAAAVAPAPAAADPAPLEDGLRRVHQAIAQRQWTPEDAAGLGHTLEAAAPEQREAILRALIPALNRGELRLTYRGELF